MEEGPACGAVDLGWGSTLYRGVCVCRGVTTLTFHVPPPPPFPLPPFHPRRVSLSGFHDDPVAVALQPKKQAGA